MKDIKEYICETRQQQYRVQFLDCSIDATILIDKDDVSKFEKFLEKEEGNTFSHAEGGSIEEY